MDIKGEIQIFKMGKKKGWGVGWGGGVVHKKGGNEKLLFEKKIICNIKTISTFSNFEKTIILNAAKYY